MRPPRQFSLLVLLAVTTGAGLMLAALVPMAGALVVSSRLLDDGVQPGDGDIIDRWDQWAFSLQNGGLLAIGGALIAVGLVYGRRRWAWRSRSGIKTGLFERH